MRDAGGVVAILFTDLVGSTEVLDRLGDDAAEELRRTHFSLLRLAVAETQGTEIKSLGDGMMVTFVSPVQALSCAVRMQRALAEHNRIHPDRTLHLRVGLHAGDPVRDESDLHGTAVVVAKRLCDRAGGGQILASELVAGLVGKRGEFCLRRVGHLKLKGLSEPIPAVTVDWDGTTPSPRPGEGSAGGHQFLSSAPPSPTYPLVGRQSELGVIQESLTAAAGGQGRVVFVTGQMGMGKTRLVEEALVLAHTRGFLLLVGRTPAAGSGLAYAPLLSAFGAVLRSLSPAAREDLTGDLPHLRRLWPELGLPAIPPVHDAELERALIFEAMARLLERLSAHTPVALFVDDLHWGDSPSLSLLGYLIPTVAAAPVALVGAYRPEGVFENKALHQFVASARRAGIATEVPLQGLDADGVVELTSGLLGGAAPRSVIELSARAAGTPLFVEALIRGLLDTGGLVKSDCGWILAGDHTSTLPRSLQDLIADRLDLLPATARSTLELIAHGPQGLPHDLLEKAAGVEPDELVEVVRRLVEAGLVVRGDEGPEIGYRLAHPLIQEVTNTEVAAIAGRRLHARLAGAVEELRPRDLDRLAYHYWRAGGEVDRARALEVLLEAGERAHGLAAHDEAARHFGAALPLVQQGQRPELLPHLLERLGESWELLGETAAAMEVWNQAVAEEERAGDVRGVARLHRRLALAAQAAGDMAGAADHLTAGIEALHELVPSDELVELHAARLLINTPLIEGRAEEAGDELARLAERVGTPRAKAQALLAPVPGMWLGGGLPVDDPRPTALAAEALRIAEGGGEWVLARRAHRELAWLALQRGDHAAMRHHALAQLPIDRRLGDIAHESSVLLQSGFAAFLAGDLDEALRLAEAGVAHARRYDQPRSLSQCLGQLALVQSYRGDLDAAEEHLAEARQILPQLLTDPRAGSLLRWSDAVLGLERGDLPRVHKAVGHLSFPLPRMLVGAAQVQAGDLEAAVSTASLLTGAGSAGSYAAGLADRLRGLIDRARGDTEAARQYLECSAVTFDGLELPLEAAISRLEAGTVESVQEALLAFEARGAARFADRARRALRSLGVRLPSPGSGHRRDQPLSRREMEVACLVSEGLSNAQIAQRLVVSVRTVESHLAHIYTRLGISSRTALARWVTAGRAASAS